MRPKKASTAGLHSVQHMAQASYRPQVVYSRDGASGASEAPAQPPRIVIVEDDFLVASVAEAALTQAGFDIAGVASSAEEALELARTERPALIVMDIRLAGSRDGVDAALELFQTHGIRCVFATAHYDPATKARAQPANPLAWVSKPYTPPSLVAEVRRALLEVEGNKK